MAPGSITPVEGVTNQPSETTNSQTQRKPAQQQKTNDKRSVDSRIQTSSLHGNQQKVKNLHFTVA